MSFRHVLVLSTFVASLALATSIGAQEGGGRRGGGRGGFFGGMGGMIDKPALLAVEKVRTELKLKDEQKKKLDEVLAAHREASQEIFQSSRGGRDLSDEERAKRREEREKKTAELLKKTEEKLVAILEGEQTKRLEEIVLQQKGPDALVSESVVAALKLEKEQVEKIKGILAKRDEDARALLPQGGRRDGGGGERPNFEEIRAKSQKLRTDAEAAAFAVLTKEQGEAYTKLKGAAFELDRSELFRGGRGQFGGRGGQGGQGGRGGQGGGERRRPAQDDEV